MPSAVVLFSGGQDSTTCLAWAQSSFDKVLALSVNYSQRHAVELECAEDLCQSLGVEQMVVDVPFYKTLGGNALVDQEQELNLNGGLNHLPSSFVPGRNALFLTLAASVAAMRGTLNIVLGACETDFSGYPDCRRIFVESMQESLSLAMDLKFKIHTPLMDLNKAQTFELADNLGVLDLIIQKTHTCYEGNRQSLHPWGYGCGLCPACELRARGYQDFLMESKKHG